MNDRLYLYFGTVAKNESYNLKNNKTHTIADDNGFAGKVGKLIGRCYCRLLPQFNFYNIAKNKIGFEFGWLIWNTEISYYYKNK